MVNAQGGYAVLESLGFKTEGEMAKNKTVAEPKKQVRVAIEKYKNEAKVCTRNEMMLEVKSMGIKNFRVMNKEELTAIINGAPKAQIEAIQLAAVTRWKSGWNKEKKV